MLGCSQKQSRQIRHIPVAAFLCIRAAEIHGVVRLHQNNDGNDDKVVYGEINSTFP